MSLLDKLHDKALGQKKKHLRYPLLVASGIADYLAGTYEEHQRHKDKFKDSGDDLAESVRNYSLYTDGTYASLTGEILAGQYGMTRWPLPAVYLLTADVLVRSMNRLVKPKENWIGIIGSARSLGYRLADRLKHGEDEAEPELTADVEPEPNANPAVL